ncbi:hypothetical protein AB4144_64850, partial [Rhizobiaceae sp. 2RAB30]
MFLAVEFRREMPTPVRRYVRSPRHPDTVVLGNMIKEAGKAPGTPGMPYHAWMQADIQQLWRAIAFFIKLIEG